MSRNNAKRTNNLGEDSIITLMFRLGLPAIIAQIVSALYNMVDRMYIGHIPATGKLALTGLGVCFPILMLVTALCVLVGAGGGARAAIHMGEGDNDRASEIMGNCVVLLVVLGVVSTVILEVIREPMLLLFGASQDTIGYATDYLGIYLVGSTFVMLSTGMNNFISTQGFSTKSMTTVLIGAVLNIILDPIFIFAFHMGVQGAALATVLSQLVSAIWVLAFLSGRRTRLRLQRKYFRLRSKVLLPVLAIGVSPFVMNATESLLNISFNASLQRYGGDMAVGTMTIASSLFQIFYMIMNGFAQGAQPIIGFNYGAGKLDRVKRTCSLLVRAEMSWAILWGILFQIFPGVFIGIFSSDQELIAYAIPYVRVYMVGIFVSGIQGSRQQSFVALGQAKISLFLALLRKVILLIPLIFILPHFFAEKVFAVFLAEPIADILAAATTGTLFAVNLPKILERRRVALAEGDGHDS